jgi:hypothetical protein
MTSFQVKAISRTRKALTEDYLCGVASPSPPLSGFRRFADCGTEARLLMEHDYYTKYRYLQTEGEIFPKYVLI